MTRELIEALFRDDIFVCGVDFGALIGFAGGVFFSILMVSCIKDFKKLKHSETNEDKEK